MAVRDPSRLLIHGAVLLAILLLAWTVWEQDVFGSGPRCGKCFGTGAFIVQELPPGCCVTMPVRKPCWVCLGSGKLPMAARFRKAFPKIVLGFWEGVCGVAVVALLLRLRFVDCRLCGGVGRLSLDALPPGEPGFTVETDCVGCEARGRLRVLERWGPS